MFGRGFRFTLLLLLVTSLSAVARIQIFRTNSFEKFSALEAYQNSGRRIVFIDVDNTLALQNESSHDWVLYNGSRQFVERVSSRFVVVLLTANAEDNIQSLIRAHPWLQNAAKVIVTSEDYSPHFHWMLEDMKRAGIPTHGQSREQWRESLYRIWQQNPYRYLPAGTVLDPMPRDSEAWRKDIYLPMIFPDKSELVLHFDAILVDDRFANEDNKSSYEELRRQGRGIYAGPVGALTPESGANFEVIWDLLLKSDAKLSKQCAAAL